ncbi:MAG: ankyrin repeat domain-containing protein [Armatimonadota bacterium]
MNTDNTAKQTEPSASEPQNNDTTIVTGPEPADPQVLPVQTTDRYGWSPLHTACRNGDLHLAQALLAAGADPSARSEGGGTPLHQAAAGGHLEVMEWLAGLPGVQVTATDEEGQSPLHWAAFAGQPSVMAWLVGHGCDPEASSAENYTPLLCAVELDREDAVKRLLELGANPNTTDDEQRSPLHICARTGNSTIAEHLIRAGAHPDAEDRRPYCSQLGASVILCYINNPPDLSEEVDH